MNLANQWTGNNTTDDIVGGANLTWEGTPDYQDGAFKLNVVNDKIVNKLIFPYIAIETGIPCSFSGTVFAQNYNCFPRIMTKFGENTGLALIFDFNEGLFDIAVNGLFGGYQLLYFASRTEDPNWAYPNTFSDWHTWKLNYNGNVTWDLSIDDYPVPPTATFGDFNPVNTLTADYPFSLYNDSQFGDSYVLVKDLCIYK